MDVSKLQEKKAALEDELQRTERQIYDLEGEYLQVRSAPAASQGWRCSLMRCARARRRR